MSNPATSSSGLTLRPVRAFAKMRITKVAIVFRVSLALLESSSGIYLLRDAFYLFLCPAFRAGRFF